MKTAPTTNNQYRNPELLLYIDFSTVRQKPVSFATPEEGYRRLLHTPRQICMGTSVQAGKTDVDLNKKATTTGQFDENTVKYMFIACFAAGEKLLFLNFFAIDDVKFARTSA